MNGFGGGDVIDSADSTDSAIVPSDTVADPTELPVEVPAAPAVVDEEKDAAAELERQYRSDYSSAEQLYNQEKYSECKSRCQSMLSSYPSHRGEINALISKCDSAIAAEEEAVLEQQYQSDYATAELLYNQKKYSECKSRCESMLNSYPAHRSEINTLISMCNNAISAAEQVAASSRLPDKAVDLGLSVLWADRNVGASSPSDYGGYYAWGETTTKSKYTWYGYRYYDGSSCTNIGSNIAGTYYDVACQKWSGGWKMPTKAQWQELIDNCTWTWTTQGGHSGYKVTSKKNGNSIFLPAAGYCNGTVSFDVGSNGNYWSSTLDESNANSAWNLSFNGGSHDVDGGLRGRGHTVRPVCNK